MLRYYEREHICLKFYKPITFNNEEFNMSKFKKISSIVIATTLILSCLPTQVFAATLTPPDISSDSIDTELLAELCNSINDLETTITSTGIKMTTYLSTKQRDEEFYEYLNEYLESRFPDEMAELRVLEENSDIDNMISLYSASNDTDRKVHAVEDAKWSISQRPDLNFAEEVLYQYTSHYIDVNQPFSGTFVDCGLVTYEKYITDSDRSAYAQFYKKGNGIKIYNNIMSLLTTAAQAPDVTKDWIARTKKEHLSILNKISLLDGTYESIKSIYENSSQLMNNSYNKIVNAKYSSKEELFEIFDNLINEIEETLKPNYDKEALNYAKGVFFVIAGIVTGSSVVATAAGLWGSTNDVLVTFINRVNFIAMRSQIQSRVGSRFMYYEGW